MLDIVKMALRINHNVLDDDIQLTIEAAKAEAIRLGLPSTLIEAEENPLVISLIKTYCLYAYAEKDNAERYWESFQYQLDNLRKSATYVEGVE